MDAAINLKIITLFNKAVVSNANFNFEVVNKGAIRLGYIIHPDICNDGVTAFLNTMNIDMNSTFYKSWNDITDKNREELLMDQILHYASTYGTNFEGEVYLPQGDIELPELKNYKVILPISKEEVSERCTQMLYSGVALTQEVITDIVDIIKAVDGVVRMDLIKNKEALMLFHKLTDTIPVLPDEMVRYMVYLAIGSTLLIKDQSTINAIKNTNIEISELVDRFGYDKLAAVFHRFKLIFLAFKTTKDNNRCVNKLRNLAKTCHIPMPVNYFATLLTDVNALPSLPERLKDLNNFKKIGLLHTISTRLKEESHRFFPIRNQKLFVKEGNVSLGTFEVQYYKVVYEIIYKSLVDSIREKATTFSIPKGVSIKLPSTAKSFIGNYPIGSSFDMTGIDNIVGINWKGVDGASDLDFSLMSIDGTKYGWNAAYTNHDNSVIFSGDMTSANPEATELFYTKNNFDSALVKVNLFSGDIGSKFRFFLASEPINNITRNYMVNPDNVLVNVEGECKSKETILGVLTGTQFILAQFRSGNKAVSGKSITDLYTEHALTTLDCYLDLEKVLLDAGFNVVDKNPEINFGDLSKDTIINLLS